jgi:hypothetical protein
MVRGITQIRKKGMKHRSDYYLFVEAQDLRKFRFSLACEFGR